MGKLIYDGELAIPFDDRLLSHLQYVIGTKLRRSEGFYFSWREDARSGEGRSSVWMHPTVPIRFKYAGTVSVTLNREWLEALAVTANSAAGLSIVPEPEQSS